MFHRYLYSCAVSTSKKRLGSCAVYLVWCTCGIPRTSLLTTLSVRCAGVSSARPSQVGRSPWRLRRRCETSKCAFWQTGDNWWVGFPEPHFEKFGQITLPHCLLINLLNNIHLTISLRVIFWNHPRNPYPILKSAPNGSLPFTQESLSYSPLQTLLEILHNINRNPSKIFV